MAEDTGQKVASATQTTSGEKAPARSRVQTGPSMNAPAFVIRSTRREERWLKMLVYGDYGVGKTYLAATSADVPEMRDVLLADAEAGDMTLDGRDDIDEVPITNYRQFARLFEFLRMHCRARDANDVDTLARLEMKFKALPEKPANPRRYRTLIVDSLTEVQKYCMYQLLGIEVGSFALDVEPDSPQYAEWNRSAEMIRLLVRSLRNLAMNVVFVCSRGEDQDDKKRYYYVPNLPGKLSNEVQGFLDVVGYYVAVPTADGKDIRRRLYLAPGPNFKAKNRFKGFKGTYIDDPTMADIVKLNKD